MNYRDDLVGRVIDLRLEQGNPEDLQFAYDTLRKRQFHSWEGKYGIHSAWVDVNRRLGDAAFLRKDYKNSLVYYRQAGEYPKNLEVAPRTPDFQAHVNWDIARAYTAMGNQDAAREHLRKILGEVW